MMKNKPVKDIAIYQAKSGAIEFRGDSEHETIWGNLAQIAELFGRDKSVISRHIRNILTTEELEGSATVAKIATVQKEGKREVTRSIEYYNLDMILSVGYRVDSKQATQFRKWATNTLKQHLLHGYTINKKHIAKNHEKFMQAMANVKSLLPSNRALKAEDALELINAFADTWFSLDAYDKGNLPKSGASKNQVTFTAEELNKALKTLKKDLLRKKEASEIFAREQQSGNVAGIVGNVFQSVSGKDAYSSIEEKAAHLLYFMIKNHPFIDGNKRSGAFAFVWFLKKAGMLRASLSPAALTALTLLIAESSPNGKDKMIGLILVLLNRDYE